MFLYGNAHDFVLDQTEMRLNPRRAADLTPAAEEFPLSFNAAKACAVEEFERTYVARALKAAHGNILAAARKSG